MLQALFSPGKNPGSAQRSTPGGMSTYPKYFRSRQGQPPVCLRRDTDTAATVVHIPEPNAFLPIAHYRLAGSKDELDGICATMLPTTDVRYEEFMIALYSQAKSNAQQLHNSRQQRYETGQLNL